MLSKVVTINGKQYELTIRVSKGSEYFKYEADFTDDKNWNVWYGAWTYTGDNPRFIPNYIEIAKKACHSFKTELNFQQQCKQAEKDFEEWDGNFE